MKAIAKHPTTVLKYMSPKIADYEMIKVKEGEILDLSMIQINRMSDCLRDKLGELEIVLKDGLFYISTFSKDFKYVI
jgi:hypothetical protein